MNPLLIGGIGLGLYLLTRSTDSRGGSPSPVLQSEIESLTAVQPTAFLTDLLPTDVIDLNVASASFKFLNMPFPNHLETGNPVVKASEVIGILTAKDTGATYPSQIVYEGGIRKKIPGNVFTTSPFKFQLDYSNFDEVKTLSYFETGSVIIEINSNDELQYFGSLLGNLQFQALLAPTTNRQALNAIEKWRNFFSYNRFILSKSYAQKIVDAIDSFWLNETCPDSVAVSKGPGFMGSRLKTYLNSRYNYTGSDSKINQRIPNCSSVNSELKIQFPDFYGGNMPSQVTVDGVSLLDSVRLYTLKENACIRFYNACFQLATENIAKTGSILNDIASITANVFGTVFGAVRMGFGDYAGGGREVLSNALSVVGKGLAISGKVENKYKELETIFKNIESSYNSLQKRLFSRGYAVPYLTNRFIADRYKMNKIPCYPWVASEDPDMYPGQYSFDGFFPNYLSLISAYTLDGGKSADWNRIAPQIGSIIAQVSFQTPVFYTPVDNDLLTIKPIKRGGVVTCTYLEEIDEAYLKNLDKG